MARQSAAETSAGGVMVRRAPQGFDVCLILRRRHHGEAWCLPKGHLEAGEEPGAAALREVQEETGVAAELLAPLANVSYRFVAPQDGRRILKHVHFFLMRARPEPLRPPDPHEVLEVRWWPLEQARQEATYENERRLLDAAAALLAQPRIAAQVG